jgi:hypothetical protein
MATKTNTKKAKGSPPRKKPSAPKPPREATPPEYAHMLGVANEAFGKVKNPNRTAATVAYAVIQELIKRAGTSKEFVAILTVAKEEVSLGLPPGDGATPADDNSSRQERTGP